MSRTHSRSFPALALAIEALAALAALAACSSGVEGAGHNVLLVTLDTVRADHFSGYGFEGGRTPGFDSVGDEGVRFAEAMSASAVTPVSHATILTGQFPYRHGLRVLSAAGGFRMPKHHPTLVTRMKQAGYRTLAIHSAFPVSSYFGFARDFDHFDSLEGDMQAAGTPREGEDPQTGWDTTSLQRRSDETTDRVLAAIDQSTGPFFAWVHYWDPHDSGLLPPPEYLADLDMRPKSEEEATRLRDLVYAREVEYLDEQFARLLAGLRARGLLDETLVVVVSDHGEGLSDGVERHGWGAHRMVYREQLHVPLLLRGPGIAPGRVVEELVRTADVMPTILDYLGLDPPAGLEQDGRSLRPLIEGRPDEPRIAYADQINGYDWNASMVKKRPDSKFLYSVNDGRWKLIYRPHMPNRSELFDVQADPLETQNLLGAQPEVVQRLMADLAARQPWVLREFAPDPEGYEDMSRQLGALGYTGDDAPDAPIAWSWMCPVHRETRIEGERPGRCATCAAILVPVESAR